MKYSLCHPKLGIFIGVVEHHARWSSTDPEFVEAILLDEKDSIISYLERHYKLNDIIAIEISTEKHFMSIRDIKLISNVEQIINQLKTE